MSDFQKEPFIDLAGGRIRCRRCQAKSKRSGRQCRKPALNGKRVCDFHGGKSTGPKTPQGRQRIADAQTTHGRETREIREQRSASSAYMMELEDVAWALGMMTGTRTRGRKPNGYWPIKNTQQAVDWIIQDMLKTVAVKP